MIKKVINSVDFAGNSYTEEALFHMTKADLAEMNYSVDGGLEQFINTIREENDSAKMYAFFKDLVLKAYGKRSEDNRRFIKSAKLSEEFSQTNGFSDLIFELITDEDKAAEFMRNVIPSVD